MIQWSEYVHSASVLADQFNKLCFFSTNASQGQMLLQTWVPSFYFLSKKADHLFQHVAYICTLSLHVTEKGASTRLPYKHCPCGGI